MIQIKNDNNIELKRVIHTKLRKNNRRKCKQLKDNTSENVDKSSTKPSNSLAFDDNKLIGGAIGFIEYDWYFLDLLYIDEEYRGQDIGSNLLKQIEDFARGRKTNRCQNGNMGFSSERILRKNGYKVFGKIKDCPPNTVCYFFKKERSILDYRG